MAFRMMDDFQSQGNLDFACFSLLKSLLEFISVTTYCSEESLPTVKISVTLDLNFLVLWMRQ